MAKLYFDLTEREIGDYKKIWNLNASGGFLKTKKHGKMTFYGNIDVREGLGLVIENLRATGKIESKWRSGFSDHFFWFIHHQEIKDIDKYVGKDDWNCRSKRYDMISKSRINRLPDYVRSAIGR